MDKKKVIKFIGITYAVSWTIQIIVSILFLKYGGMKGKMIFQGGLSVCMFTPLIATLIVKADMKGMGWKPKFKGNIKWIIYSITIPMIVTLLGFVCFFLIFPDLFSLDGVYMYNTMKELGMNDAEIKKALGMAGLDMKKLLLITILQVTFEAPIINMFFAIGEEAGWRGFLYPELKKNFSRVKTWIIGGVVWAAFHFPCMLLAGYEYGTNYIGAPVLGIVTFSIFCVMLGIIEEIIYDKTKCIWYPALFHGAINAAATVFQLVINGNEVEKIEKLMIFGPAPNGLIAGIPLLIVAIIMAVIVLKKEKNA